MIHNFLPNKEVKCFIISLVFLGWLPQCRQEFHNQRYTPDEEIKCFIISLVFLGWLPQCRQEFYNQRYTPDEEGTSIGNTWENQTLPDSVCRF